MTRVLNVTVSREACSFCASTRLAAARVTHRRPILLENVVVRVALVRTREMSFSLLMAFSSWIAMLDHYLKRQSAQKTRNGQKDLRRYSHSSGDLVGRFDQCKKCFVDVLWRRGWVQPSRNRNETRDEEIPCVTPRMDRKPDSCLPSRISGMSRGCATRQYVAGQPCLGFGVHNRGRSVRIILENRARQKPVGARFIFPADETPTAVQNRRRN